MTVGEREEGGGGRGRGGGNQIASTVEVDEVWFMHTVNQLLFAFNKYSRGLRGPRRGKYFPPRTSCYYMYIVVIRKWVWTRLGREQ